MEYFKIKNRRMPWGDYGSILLHGMAQHLSRKSGHMQLERTGPFIPDVIDSGISNIVISDKVKLALENSGLPNLVFRKVMLARYVIIPWHQWDFSLDEPPFYPDSGEPEDYILEGMHDEVAARSIHLWEPVPTMKYESRRGPSGLMLIAKNLCNDGFIGLERTDRVYLSQSTMLVIADYLDGWASFDPIEVTVVP